MTLIQRIKQRYTDFIHEGAIRAADKDTVRYALRGDTLKEYAAYREYLSLCKARSPSQLKRMGVPADKLKLE
jgi:hypothetical protein